MGYYNVHRDIISKYEVSDMDNFRAGFLAMWRPRISGTLEFGDRSKEYDSIFPNEEELHRFPRKTQIKL